MIAVQGLQIYIKMKQVAHKDFWVHGENYKYFINVNSKIPDIDKKCEVEQNIFFKLLIRTCNF